MFPIFLKLSGPPTQISYIFYSKLNTETPHSYHLDQRKYSWFANLSLTALKSIKSHQKHSWSSTRLVKCWVRALSERSILVYIGWLGSSSPSRALTWILWRKSLRRRKLWTRSIFWKLCVIQTTLKFWRHSRPINIIWSWWSCVQVATYLITSESVGSSVRSMLGLCSNRSWKVSPTFTTIGLPIEISSLIIFCSTATETLKLVTLAWVEGRRRTSCCSSSAEHPRTSLRRSSRIWDTRASLSTSGPQASASTQCFMVTCPSRPTRSVTWALLSSSTRTSSTKIQWAKKLSV